MTFIQILNNPTTRSLVDQIEDVSGSLDGRDCAVLEEIRTHLIDELYKQTGFQYTLG